MWFVVDCFASYNELPLYHRVWLVRCCSLDRTFAASLGYAVQSLSIFHHVYDSRSPLCPTNACAPEKQTDESLCPHQCYTLFPCTEWTLVGLNQPFPAIKHRPVYAIYRIDMKIDYSFIGSHFDGLNATTINLRLLRVVKEYTRVISASI